MNNQFEVEDIFVWKMLTEIMIYQPNAENIWNSAHMNSSSTSNFCRKNLFLCNRVQREIDKWNQRRFSGDKLKCNKSFQGQIWDLPYLSQKWSDCHEMKKMSACRRLV